MYGKETKYRQGRSGQQATPQANARPSRGRARLSGYGSRVQDRIEARRFAGNASLETLLQKIVQFRIFVHFLPFNIRLSFNVADRIQVNAVPSGTDSSSAISRNDSPPSTRNSRT